MMDDNLFTRAEVLPGLTQKRARLALFLIESHTARLAAQEQHAMERFPSAVEEEARDLQFLEAFSAGKAPPMRPTIQDLEKHVSSWMHLVPEAPRLRATLANLLAERYSFTYADVPGLRRSLGLDEAAVRQAYERLYQAPVESLYLSRPRPAERLRWVGAQTASWLESLPPFWTAFALTLTETVGASLLALPIALAGIGPLPGIAILVAIGLVNVLTILYMAETLTRTGSVRYGRAYFGRLVTDYLGRPGSLLFSAGLLLLNFLVLIAYFIGFSTTLADATRLPAGIWCALLFAVTLFFLRRESLRATIASALIIGAVNLLLVICLSLLGLAHVRPEYLLRVNLPWLNGQPFDPSTLYLVFGIVLAAYFGHTSIANCARVVLRRDTSGRALIWGCMAAQAAAIGLYSLFILGVNGAIPAQELANQHGTALAPLANLAGPVVHVIGSIFVILGMGMASIHFSLGSFNLVRERLPARRQPVVLLPRRRGRMVFSTPGWASNPLRIGLAFLGLDGGLPLFHVQVQARDRLHQLTTAAVGRLDIASLLEDSLPEHFPAFEASLEGRDLNIEVIEATQSFSKLKIITSLSIRYSGEWDSAGFEMATLFELPDEQRRLLKWMMRQPKVTLSGILAHTGSREEEIEQVLEALTARGYIRKISGAHGLHYQAVFQPKRGRSIPDPLKRHLEERDSASNQQTPSGSRAIQGSGLGQAWRQLLGERGSFWISTSPVIFVFLLVEWLLWTSSESFAAPLNFAGILVISMLGGIYPTLLLIASRRKGELLPGVVYRRLGHPLVAGAIYLLSLGTLFLHGLVIWQDPIHRLVAVAAGVLLIGMTLWIYQQGAFSPRWVIELRASSGGQSGAAFNLLAGGKPARAGVLLVYPGELQERTAGQGEIQDFANLREAVFELSGAPFRAVKVWAHRVDALGGSEGLPARVELKCSGLTFEQDAELAGESGGEALIHFPAREGCQPIVRVVLRTGSGKEN